MTKEITRYHNDLNKIQMPNLAELEQDLLFSIITNIRNKPTGEKICFKSDELRKMLKRNVTDEELFTIAHDLRWKFFKADFKIILPQDERGRYGSETINLFKMYRMWWLINERNVEYLEELEIIVNERFEYLLNELIDNYTEFELAEFIDLTGKYTKRLYTHLKQFRTTGKWIVEWREFRQIMNIPEALKLSDIDKILKQSIKDLEKERTLLNQQRIPFKNLKYQKLTRNREPNRRKLTPYYIEFTFKPEETTKTLKDKLEDIRWTWDGIDYEVQDVKKQNGKVVVSCLKIVNGFTISGKSKVFKFKTYDGAKSTILSNQIKDNPA